MREIIRMFVTAVVATAVIIGMYTFICMKAFPDVYYKNHRDGAEAAAADIRPLAVVLVEASSMDMLFSACSHAAFAITPLSYNEE